MKSVSFEEVNIKEVKIMIAPDAHEALKGLRFFSERIEKEYNPLLIKLFVSRFMECFESFLCLQKVRRSIYEMPPDNNDQSNILQNFDSLVEYKIGKIGKDQLVQSIARVYEYSKKTLLFGNNINNVQKPSTNTAVLDIFYDGDSGAFTIQGYEKTENFAPKSVEGQLLCCLSPGGRPCKVPMPVDEIREDICYRIKMKGIKAQNNSIDKARCRINKKLENKFGKPEMLIQEKGRILWNPSYQYTHSSPLK